MTGLVVGICLVLGLAVGSFLNVVVHRVPAGLSVVKPRSRCPACEAEIGPRDNVPVLSWLLLRGRCRACSAPISARYPAVEVATAVLFAAVGWRFADDWALPAFLVLTAGLVALSAIDLDTYRLPRSVIYATAGAGGVLLAAAGAATGDWRGLAEAAAGAAIAFVALFAIHVASPRGMGFGDVRLAGLVGAFLGWIELPLVGVGLFFAFLLASVVGVGLMVTRRRGRKDRVPFGPFLAAGAMVAVFVGTRVLDVYLGR